MQEPEKKGAGARPCAACGAEVGEAKFCPECGEAVAPPRAACAACGHEPEAATKFCPECGVELAAC